MKQFQRPHQLKQKIKFYHLKNKNYGNNKMDIGPNTFGNTF